MKKLLFVVLALTLIIACSKTEEKKVEGTDQQMVTTQEAPQPPVVNQRYGIKSGVIFYNAPMDTKQELYFDDYGAKEVSITLIDMGMAKSKNIDIRKDGFSYTFEEGKTVGTKRAWYVTNTDYSKADPKTIERYKVKDLGTETIAGKDCKKFSAEFGGSPIVSWTWNNILIKSVTKMGGADFVIEATKIQEGSVDSKIFELPAGVTFKEM